MNRGHKAFRPIDGMETAAIPTDPELRSHQGLCRRRAQRDYNLGLDERDLGLQPWLAGGDFPRARFLVEAALAHRLPLEVLHNVGDVNLFPVESFLFKAGIEQLAGGADKGMALEILLIARLFAYEHDASMFRSFAKDCLRRVSIQGATGAYLGETGQSVATFSLRNRVGIAHVLQ